MKFQPTLLCVLAVALGLLNPDRTQVSHAEEMSSPIVRKEVTRLDGRTLSPADVEATVRELMAAGRVTGMGIAIINNGEICYLGAFGKRNIKEDLPLKPHTAMAAASFTKVMFSHMVMQLVDAQKLDLDKPIQDFVPQPIAKYEAYADLAGDGRIARITPRMCLTHTTGLPNWRFITRSGIDRTAPLSMWFEPGKQYSYSGEGIQLLQLAVEEGLNLNIDQEMQRRVFDRFNMSRTSMTWRQDFARDCAVGYDEQEQELSHRRRTQSMAAGSAYTTVADMAQFLRAMLRGDALSKSAHQQTLEPQVRIRTPHQFPVGSTEAVSDNDAVQLSYGLGWGLLETPHGKAFFKEGHDDGWENYMIAFEKPQTGIVLMCNSANGESIFKYLLERLIGDTFTPWRWERYTPYDAEIEQ